MKALMLLRKRSLVSEFFRSRSSSWLRMLEDGEEVRYSPRPRRVRKSRASEMRRIPSRSTLPSWSSS